MLKAEWFNIREKDDFAKYYPTLSSWWEEWKWNAVEDGALPENGIMVSIDGKNVCAGWIWSTDSLMCLLGFIISDKNIKGKQKRDSLIFLIKNLEDLAKKLNFKVIYFPVTVDSLASLASSEFGFQDVGKINECFKLI